MKLGVRFCSLMSILHLCLFIFTRILRLGVIGRLCSLSSWPIGVVLCSTRCACGRSRLRTVMLLNGHVRSAPAVCGCCALHGIVVIDDGNFSDALLRHCFTGFCALAWDDAMHLACWEVCHALWSHARTGSKQLQSLVDAGVLTYATLSTIDN